MKRNFSLKYRIFVILSLVTGLTLNLMYTPNITYLMSYYTMQSNAVCLFIFVILVMLDIMKIEYQNDIYYVIKGAVIITIMITFIGYFATLLPNNFPMYTDKYIIKKIGNVFVHLISPLMVFGDYLIFDKKGKFKVLYPFIWLFFPIVYVCFVYSGKGHFYNIGGSKKFGYFFLDYEVLGIEQTIRYLLIFIISIIALGYMLFFIDKILKCKK